MEWDSVLKGRVYGQHIGLGSRRYASRTAHLRGSEYIVRLLVFVDRIASLLACLLDVSKRISCRLWHRHRSKIFVMYDGLVRHRNGFLRFVGLRLRHGRFDRIAVGLRPLESTSNDW